VELCPAHFRLVICIFAEFSDDFLVVSILFFGSSFYFSNIFVILEMNFRSHALFMNFKMVSLAYFLLFFEF